MNPRLYFIDWLRVLAFLTLIVFHCAVPFVEDYHWEINSDQTSPTITRLVWWFHQWRLPLLFFISGVGVRFSLRRRSVGAFFGERFLRLFIPLWFAIFCITPIQVYFEWLQEGRIQMSYADFYPSVFDFVTYPQGSFTWSHMWFVAYLFVFTLLLLPLFALSKRYKGKRLKATIESLISHPAGLVGLAIPLVLCFYGLYIDWPEQGSLVSDWFVFCSSILLYFYGFVLSSTELFWQQCHRYRKGLATMALVLTVVLMWRYYWNWSAYKPTKQDLNLYLYGTLNGFHIWLILLTLIGYAREYLNRPGRYLNYLNTAVYPYYIMHQAIIVASGYYILQWPVGIFMKVMILVLCCLLSMGVLYHYIIRNTLVTRILFGMKWQKPKELPAGVQPMPATP